MKTLAWNNKMRRWEVASEATVPMVSIETSADIKPAVESMFSDPRERQYAVFALYGPLAKSGGGPIRLAASVAAL